MGLKLNTASSGSVTIEPTNTASNFTLTVPAQDGTVIAADSSGNVGIGTSSPATELHISSAAPILTATATNGVSGLRLNIVGGGDQILRIQDNGTERMIIDSSGNLLVGGFNVLGVGINQTWQNVGASRAANTTYTNTTGRPILWSIRISNSSSLFTITIDGIALTNMGNTGTTGGSNVYTFVIPNGSTYRSSTVGTWLELR